MNHSGWHSKVFEALLLVVVLIIVSEVVSRRLAPLLPDLVVAGVALWAVSAVMRRH